MKKTETDLVPIDFLRATALLLHGSEIMIKSDEGSQLWLYRYEQETDREILARFIEILNTYNIMLIRFYAVLDQAGRAQVVITPRPRIIHTEKFIRKQSNEVANIGRF